METSFVIKFSCRECPLSLSPHLPPLALKSILKSERDKHFCERETLIGCLCCAPRPGNRTHNPAVQGTAPDHRSHPARAPFCLSGTCHVVVNSVSCSPLSQLAEAGFAKCAGGRRCLSPPALQSWWGLRCSVVSLRGENCVPCPGGIRLGQVSGRDV